MDEFGAFMKFWLIPLNFAVAGVVLLRRFPKDHWRIVVGLLWVGGILLLIQLSKLIAAIENLHRIILIYGQIG